MNNFSLRPLSVFSCICFSTFAHAELAIDKNLKSGEQVYGQVCIACHETGVAHAPKFKDNVAWAPLISEGQAVLTSHAWVGVRAMPAKGGNPDLHLVEFSRAVAYMASNSGGDWQEPDASMMKQIMKETENRLDKSIREAQAMKKELHNLIEVQDSKSQQ
jgi:cytochrome c5